LQLLTENILPLLGGELIGIFPDVFPLDIITDSRKAFISSGALFVALKGPNFDGHSYCKEVMSKGVQLFLVSEKTAVPKGANALVVKDTLLALQTIAGEHRKQFKIPVVAITGSNGKTIVKDWLAELCNGSFSIFKSPKSYNSQLGVALSLLGIREYHTLAIIEAGISQVGEMVKLQEMILPTHGVFTHFGTAHASGFRSKEEKFGEKQKLFATCKTVVVQEKEIKDGMSKGRFDIIQASKIDSDNYIFPIQEDTAIKNIKTAIAAAQMLGVSEEKIRENLPSIQPLNMRLEQLQGINNCEILNDGYSLDMDSLKIALNFMKRQGKSLSYTVLISDFDYSISPKKDYEKMGKLFRQIGVKKVIGIGEEITLYKNEFKYFDSDFYPSVDVFLSVYDLRKFKNERILLKGARKFKLERIASVLQEKVHSTYVEINLNKLSQNIDYFRSILKEGTKLMAMVKASSYGSGTHEIANLLEYKKLDYLCVAYPDEGIELRKAGVSIPIMVLSSDANSLHSCLAYHLEPVVYNLGLLEQVKRETKEKSLRIHLELDTGMKRLGLEKEDIGLANKIISENSNIILGSVFSHLAAADEMAFDDFTMEQINSFKELSALVESDSMRHFCNTSGILRFPQAHFDMVRLGIGMYGIDPTGGEESLECALSLKTVVSQIRKIKKGESIGYSRSFIADKGMTIGILPIGYADGIKRILSNGRGKVYVKGIPCKIVGNVCMDMCMIDLTSINCEEGEEVVLFENSTQLNQLAKDMETISYEVFTGISARVKRVFVEE